MLQRYPDTSKSPTTAYCSSQLQQGTYLIRLKYTDNGNMDSACMEAIQQIQKKHYDVKLKDDGMRIIIKYGIACYKKECRVLSGD